MKPNTPEGFAALLAKMPRRFVARAQRVEERARLRREAQARQFEELPAAAVEVRDSARNEWQDTVAQFNTQSGEDHGIA